jgi:ribosomal protein S3
VTIHTARPGIVIGKKGEDVEKLRKVVADIAGVPAQINIAEVVSLNWTQNWLLTASLLSWNVALCSVAL